MRDGETEERNEQVAEDRLRAGAVTFQDILGDLRRSCSKPPESLQVGMRVRGRDEIQRDNGDGPAFCRKPGVLRRRVAPRGPRELERWIVAQDRFL